jgi:hypothetical protein
MSLQRHVASPPCSTGVSLVQQLSSKVLDAWFCRFELISKG